MNLRVYVLFAFMGVFQLVLQQSDRCLWLVPFYALDLLPLGFFISSFPWACVGHLKQSSGCLACHNKPKLISSPKEPWERQNYPCQLSSNPTIFEDYLATSTCDMDHSAVQSHRSISSTSTLTQFNDANGDGSSIKPAEFVNHGFLLWNQNRQKWIGNKKRDTRAHQQREPTLSWNASYDSLLSNNKRFSKPIPLTEMVDFLVDIWEQEGMYD